MDFSIISILKGIIGIAFFLFIAWLFSTNRKAINWKLVGKGIALQMIIALMVLKIPLVENIFDGISAGFVKLISYTDYGFNFLFSNISTNQVGNQLQNFAFKLIN